MASAQEPVIEELLAILVMTGGAAITEFGEVSRWQPWSGRERSADRRRLDQNTFCWLVTEVGHQVRKLRVQAGHRLGVAWRSFAKKKISVKITLSLRNVTCGDRTQALPDRKDTSTEIEAPHATVA